MNGLHKMIIFGATSAIASHVARQSVEAGADVCCIGRDEQKLNRLLDDLRIRGSSEQIIEGYTLDLSQYDQHQVIVNQAITTLGGCDAVLLAHGRLPDQQACEASSSETLLAIKDNALCQISLLTILSECLLARKHPAVIAVISSVAGDRGRQSNYIYGAAKGMLSIYLQGLRNRLHAHMIDVVTVKPGFVRTPMTDGMARDSFLWANPDVVARGIVDAMRKGRSVVYLPFFWRYIMWIIKTIPECVFKKIKL